MMQSDRRTESYRRASFAQINASWAIEGQVMDAVDLAMQGRLIRGEITHEQAIDEVRRNGKGCVMPGHARSCVCAGKQIIRVDVS